jgi:alcohol dehydrogenase class IV
MPESFRWHDGERTIRFGRGALADAPELLGDGYVVLTTPRAAGSAPAVVDAARERHDVPSGRVDEVAAGLLERLSGTGDALLVALGGGRVIDVAKSLTAAGAGRAVAAIPTTLSAAEMTGTHRPATGRRFSPVRPAVVINDPALSASQPQGGLAASAANALAHAIEGPMTILASPVPTLAAHEAARLIAGAWSNGEPDRDALALGALLSGYAIDAMGYGLHHIAAQTLVRKGGVGHGAANAVLLPHTVEALRRRFPERMGALDAALGTDSTGIAADLARRAGAERIRDLGLGRDALDPIAEAAAARADALALTPPAAGVAELVALYDRAW